MPRCRVKSQRRALYLITARLGDDPPTGSSVRPAALIYLDAANGDPAAVITTLDDPAQSCDFDMGAALKAAVKSPPFLLLALYAVALLAGWLVLRIKGLFR